MTESHDAPTTGTARLEGREARAREREQAREQRSTERAEMAQARAERRAAERAEASREREARRPARRPFDLTEDTPPRAEGSPEPAAAAAPKRRASGALRRTGEVRVERDTRHYKTVVDARRIRELAKRGANVEGLAKVFKLSTDEIEAILASAD